MGRTERERGLEREGAADGTVVLPVGCETMASAAQCADAAARKRARSQTATTWCELDSDRST